MEPQESEINAKAVLEHLDWVRGLARSLVLDASLADDITQETWLAASRKPAAAGGVSKGWLSRVVRNSVRQENRRAAIRREHEERASVRDEAASTDELVDRVHTQRMVVDTVLALEAPYQRVILLRYFEGLAPGDIAKRQGIPVATVKTRLRRGLERLRDALDKRNGGDRTTWMSAVTALAAPASGGIASGTLWIGGMAMGTMMKVSSAVLLVAACVFFVTRTPQAESPRVDAVEPLVADEELAAVASEGPATEAPATEVGRRSPVAEVALNDLPAGQGTSVLRLTLDGVTEESARKATVTVTGLDENSEWPAGIRDSWACEGSTNELSLDRFFAEVAARGGSLRAHELLVEVDHPQYFLERTRVPLSDGMERSGDQTVYEARVQLIPPVYWPELTLSVRDVHTRAHIEGVEIRTRSTAWMGLGHLPETDGAFTSLGGGLNSPIVLVAGRDAGEPEGEAEGSVAGLALQPAAGEAPEPAELSPNGRVRPDRGILVYARAPGYAWGSIVLDVSTGTERELLLGPAATLGIQLANVQLEGYAALETVPMLYIQQSMPDGDERMAWVQKLDETLSTEGLRLEVLEPGEYAVSVELGGAISYRKRTVLAREVLTLTAGETRELVLALPDAPEPKARAPLGGVISFPTFGGEEDVRLELYAEDFRYGGPDLEVSLNDMERVDGALPTWSFHVDDLPVGLYQVQLVPFMTSWMIELPADGAERVELIIPELAEVLVETVDALSGERIPLETIRFGHLEALPGQVSTGGNGIHEGKASVEDATGLFRFWTAPGDVYLRTYSVPSGLEYGKRRENLTLVPGLQTVRYGLEPVYAIRFEFRDGGSALPHEDGVFTGLSQGIRAVDHEGRVNPVTYWHYEATAPGLYEISFEGIGADRFLPIPARRVEVRGGVTTEVIVDLRRK